MVGLDCPILDHSNAPSCVWPVMLKISLYDRRRGMHPRRYRRFSHVASSFVTTSSIEKRSIDLTSADELHRLTRHSGLEGSSNVSDSGQQSCRFHARKVSMASISFEHHSAGTKVAWLRCNDSASASMLDCCLKRTALCNRLSLKLNKYVPVIHSQKLWTDIKDIRTSVIPYMTLVKLCNAPKAMLSAATRVAALTR